MLAFSAIHCSTDKDAEHLGNWPSSEPVDASSSDEGLLKGKGIVARLRWHAIGLLCTREKRP